ncbi:MAG: DUF1295 domain-containing protein [Chloroflexota bacterium]
MTLWMLYLSAMLLIWLSLTLLWGISLLITDASIVDIFWGAGFVFIAWCYVFLQDSITIRAWLMTLLVSLWGGRLVLYLAWRNLGKGEDFRYKRWRADAGQKWWWLSYIRVFMLQGVVMLIVSVPILGVHQTAETSLNWLDGLAIALWSIGFSFEVIGDWQLARFKSNPANEGKILDTGLWRYTRHPNYFGDAVVWWAFYILALASGAWWTIFGAITMTFFLMRVSGVPMLERSLKKRKPAYQAYVERTSSFFPLPPKSD